MKNKMISLLLVTMMAVGVFSGCGNSETNTSKNNNQADAEEPYHMTLMSDTGEITPIDQKWCDMVEEKLNIEIEWVLPESSSYNEAVSLMLLNDEKPDAVFKMGYTTDVAFREACEAGIFISLEELLPNHENLTKYITPDDYTITRLVNEEIYAVPRASISRLDGWCFNEQWLKNLGIDYTEGEYLTVDEFYDIMYQFTYNDPDGNGKDDTWSFYVTKAPDGLGSDSILQMQCIWDCAGDNWGLYDGEPLCLKYSQEHDNYKQYLSFVNKCWEDGLFDPDAMSVEGGVMWERWMANKYGGRGIFSANMDVTATEDSPQTYVFCPGVILDENDTFTAPKKQANDYGAWFITADCERPDKVLEFLDFVVSDENWINLSTRNLKDVTFEVKEDGSLDFSLLNAMSAEEKKINLIYTMLRRSASEGLDFYVSATYPQETRERLIKLVDVQLKNNAENLTANYVPESALDPVFLEYKSYMDTETAKIIAGVKPVEYWDELLEGWYEAGGTKYMEDMRAYIKEVHGY